MDKRYQVFVSSTFRDLELERQEVMQALLELDCIPSGMELFPAANETQWDLIKKVIDDCDYYVLIIAGRYGSLGTDGIGYTEMEYRYALSVGKPTIAFLHRNPGKIISENCESSREGKEQLAAFRASVEKKLCKQWDSAQELGSVVSRSLIQLIKSTPAVGWVRANELADRDATLELLRLRRQVEELESQISRSRTSAPAGTESLSQGSDLVTLEFEASVYNNDEGTTDKLSGPFEITWNQLFSSVAPLMIHESSDAEIKRALDRVAKEWAEDDVVLSSEYGEPYGFKLSQHDYQTIKIQLRSLGLIVKSVKPRSVKDSETYWTLTPYGDELMTRLRAIRRDNDPLSP